MSDWTNPDLRQLIQEAYSHVAPSGRAYRALQESFAPAEADVLPRARGADPPVRFIPLAALMVLASLVLFFAPRGHNHVPIFYTASPPAPVGMTTAFDPQLNVSFTGIWTPSRVMVDLR